MFQIISATEDSVRAELPTLDAVLRFLYTQTTIEEISDSVLVFHGEEDSLLIASGGELNAAMDFIMERATSYD